MIEKKTMALAAVSVLIIAGIGCAAFVITGSDNDRGSGDKAVSESCEPYTFTDRAGKTYTLDHTLGAVVVADSGSGGPFISMAAILGDDLCKYLAGIDNGLSDNRVNIWESYCADMPELKELPQCGSIATGWDNAAVLSLEPDALIAPYNELRNIQNNGTEAAFKAAGIPIYYVNFHSETVEDITQSVRMLGMLFGKEDRANEIADLYATKANAVYEKVDALVAEHGRPTVYVECSSNGSSSFGNSYSNTTMWGAMIYSLGGENIYNGDNYGPIDASYLLSKDPQKILLTGSVWSKPTNFVKLGFGIDKDTAVSTVTAFFEGSDARVGWSDLSAYHSNATQEKGHDVYAIGHVLSREVFDYCSLEFLAQMIWPDEFGELDADSDLREFYETYMPFTYHGTWYLNYGDEL